MTIGVFLVYVERLFLGFKLTVDLEQQLLNLDPEIRVLFFSGGDYLQEWDNGEQKYLGKMIDSVTDIAKLELLEANVLSLKRRLLPNSSEISPTIYVLAVLQPESRERTNVH